MTWTDSCEWFTGGFHVVCKSEGKGPFGEMRGLGIYGCNTEQKVYTFYGFDNSGWGELAKGTVDGKAWTFTTHGTMAGKPFHTRYLLTQVSDARQSFRIEMSKDEKTWSLMMEGESGK